MLASITLLMGDVLILDNVCLRCLWNLKFQVLFWYAWNFVAQHLKLGSNLSARKMRVRPPPPPPPPMCSWQVIIYVQGMSLESKIKVRLNTFWMYGLIIFWTLEVYRCQQWFRTADITFDLKVTVKILTLFPFLYFSSPWDTGFLWFVGGKKVLDWWYKLG